uniref:Putative secreted protein n=1 Tax=Anopheles darlingi TaxID=43151 RepID=A0A2M4DBU4_ANODA
MRSPRSGEMWSATTSWLVVSAGTAALHLLRLPPNGGSPFPALRCRSFFRCSICLIIGTMSKYLASSSSSSRSGKSSATSSFELRIKFSIWRNMPPSRSMK